eukprot:3382267-Rhodomonas_salina.1
MCGVSWRVSRVSRVHVTCAHVTCARVSRVRRACVVRVWRAPDGRAARGRCYTFADGRRYEGEYLSLIHI